MDISVTRVRSRRRVNILHLTTDAKKQLPAVYLQNRKVKVCHRVDGNNNLCKNTFNFTENVKFNLIMDQIQQKNSYAYRISVNKKIEFNIAVKNPREYDNVTIYMSNPWDEPANAEIQNFRFVNLKGKLFFSLRGCLFDKSFSKGVAGPKFLGASLLVHPRLVT